MQLVHSHVIHNTHCTECGHLLPGYGTRAAGSSRIVVAISIALHLLALVLFLAWDKIGRASSSALADSTLVYVAPMLNTPKTKGDTPAVAKSEPAREVRIAPPVAAKPVIVAPLPPNDRAITLPMETAAPVEEIQGPVIAQPPAETASERSERLASLNAESRNRGGNGNAGGASSGGAFSIVNMTRTSAEIKFAGWDPGFKRNWAQLEHVDILYEVDLETAIIKRLIQLIRLEKKADFVWYSRRLKRHVPLSARVKDEQELFDFLMLEMFPEYR